MMIKLMPKTVAEIREKHPDQWVLLLQPKRDEQKRLLSGIVLYASKSQKDLLDRADQLSQEDLACWHTGTAGPTSELDDSDEFWDLLAERQKQAALNRAKLEEAAEVINGDSNSSEEEAGSIGVPTEPLPITEINALFPNHWMLIDQPVLDEWNRLVSGTVVFAHSKKSEIYRKGAELKLKRFAIHTTRKDPPGLKYLL
jgi:hypothetical protein